MSAAEGTQVDVPRGVLMQAAMGQARLTHESRDCDALSLAAASGDRERVYCATCGAVLLSWGGDV